MTSSNGDLTTYVYAADGTRLKRTVTVGPNTTTSLYLGNVEIANPGSTDTTHWYLHPNIRVTHKSTGSPTVNYLHRDQLGSVVLVANAAGGEELERIYAPFGGQTKYVLNSSTEEEDFGFIGERLDAVAGLQYLNARYYDPELGFFTQPDWLDVRLPGVGTNRYAYSGNDPVNLIDPSGGNWEPDGTDYGVDTDDDGVQAIGTALGIYSDSPGYVQQQVNAYVADQAATALQENPSYFAGRLTPGMALLHK